MTARRFADAWPDLVDALKARYSEPHRAYHTWTHVEDLLSHFERLDWVDGVSVEIALYWHDAVYVPLSTSNEADSAALMRAAMAGRVDPTTLDRAETIVLATAAHRVADWNDPGLAADCAQFLDMDLAILGTRWDVFAAYDQAIRQEFSAVPDAVFLPRRRRIMAGFLKREHLYLTETFRRSHDARARANLARLVACLPEA